MKDLTISEIRSKIINLPGRPPVMLDRDLAVFYETDTRSINQAAKRNPDRFPDDFRFQMTKEEINHLKCQYNNIQWLQNFKYTPYAYTMEGIRSLFSCFRSPRIKDLAIRMGFDDMIVTYVENDCMATIINSVAGITDYKTQHKVDKYRVDLYLPEIDMVIECDEFDHIYRNDDYEKEREDYIANILNCEIIRFNPNGRGFNIGKIINLIFKKICIREAEPNQSFHLLPHGKKIKLYAKTVTSETPQHPRTYLPSKEHDENLIAFVSTWWEKYGDNAVDSAHLYELITESHLSIELGKGDKRSRKIRLGKMLSGLNGKQVGSYIVTDAGKHRNIRLWKLRPAGKSVIDS